MKIMLRLLLVCLLVTPGVSATETEPTPPNIIFVLVDDLGWGDLGVFYQNARKDSRKHATPEIDRFAAEGIQLRQHYCPAPVCAPSRASLLTGRHQGHEWIRDNQFDKALAPAHTLGTVLKEAGYHTIMIGKYGLPGGDRALYEMDQWDAFPTRRGFDEFFGYVKHRDGHTQYPGDDYPRGDSELHRTGKPVFHNEQRLQEALSGSYTTDLFTAFAKKWIVDHRDEHPGQPFFMYLAHSTPHAALQVPSMAYPEGGGLNGGVQWIGKPGQMINTVGGTFDGWIHPDYADKDWAEQEKRFATMVRRIDTTIGDLVQTLKDLGIDRETLIVFTSDNGPHAESYLADLNYNPTSFDSFGPFNGIKRDLLEGGIRMPTLARWPGNIPAGAINETPSQFHDWLPTLAAIAGLPAPALSDGVSLLPSLSGAGTPQPGVVYIEYLNNGNTPAYPEFEPHHRGRPRKQMQVVFVDGYKGMRTNIKSHDDDFMIYDLVSDPRESINLAGSNPYFSTLQQRMKDRVLQIRRPNASAPRPYDREPVPPMIEAPKDRKVHWMAYAGDFPWVPQTHGLTAVQSGVSGAVDAKLAKTAAVIEYRGVIEAKETANHTFTVDADGGAILRLHEAVVVDNESVIGGKRATQGSILLQKGLHPFTLIYRVGAPENPSLKFSYTR